MELREKNIFQNLFVLNKVICNLSKKPLCLHQVKTKKESFV